jgi:hypothetical protein
MKRAASGFAARAPHYPACRGSAMFRNGIYRVKKWEPIEIRVFRVDRLDAVLPHQDRRVRIKYQIAGEIRDLDENFSRNMAMPISLRQDPQT